MYFITNKQWQAIGEDFKTDHSITHGRKACFERCINPKAEGGPVMIFEGLHFIVIPEAYTTGSEEKDRLICQLLEELSTLDNEGREEWRRECMKAFEGRPEMVNFLNLAEAYIAGKLAMPGRYTTPEKGQH